MLLDPSNALAPLPPTLRDELYEEYKSIVRNFSEHRWGPAELCGGRFAEISYSILDGYAKGTYPANASKPANMVAACRALENHGHVPRSFQILIPRWLPALYEVRNNRNVGHVGSDVDPSLMDASAVLTVCSWILAEFIRVFHTMSTSDAQRTVDALVERKTPLIWEVDGKLRVLNTSLKIREQILLLLYSRASTVTAVNLASWTEYKNASRFRDDILAGLHADRLIEFDRGSDTCNISPNGIKDVESRLLK
jgi:hypothetical protein